MNIILNKKFQFVFFFVALLLFFTIKYYGPHIVQTLYADGEINLLNKITQSHGTQSLEYYLGRADDKLLGPTSSLFAGLLLLGVSFFYLKNVRAYVFAGAVLLYLMLTRSEVLLYPPYGDAVTGIFFDVMWIVRHAFDYVGLFYERNFAIGAPQMYPISFFPSLLALIMQITPSSKVFLIVSHLMIFVCGAVAAAIFREILLKIFNKDIAVIGAVTFVSLPIFQSMVEMINMEMPCLFFAILSIYFLLQKKFFVAFLWGAGALLVKAPGGIAGITIFAGSLALFFAHPKRKENIRWLICGFLGLGFTMGMFLLRKAITGKPVATNNITGLLLGWPGIRGMISFWIYLVLIGGFIFGAWVWMRANRQNRHRLSAFIDEHFEIGMMFVMTGLWFVVYVNFLVTIDRYKLLLAPFFLCCVLHVAAVVIKNKKALNLFLALFTCLCFLCSHGHFGLPYFTGDYYSGYERSLEYRNMLKRDMKTARYIEENYADKMIGAPFVLAYALNFADIGYVSKPMAVTLYGMPSRHEQEGVYSFDGLAKMDILNTVWLGYADYKVFDDFDYPVSKDDKILHEIEAGDKKVIIFMGGFAIEMVRIAVQLFSSGQIERFLNK